MVQKAKKPTRTTDRINSLNAHKSTLYALNRFNQSPQTSATAFFANTGGAAGGSTAAAGNYLETQGDTMIGPIAYSPTTVFIDGSGVLDISADTTSSRKSSSYVIASFSSPDTLEQIKGAQFAGQQLWLQVPAASVLTIEDYSSNASGNIVTSDGTDLVITTTTDPVTFTLLFDITLSPNGATGGWVVLNAKSVTGGSGTASFPLAYTVDDQSSKSGTVTHSLTATTAHKLQFTATADCDITITGFGSGGAAAVDFYIEVTQDGTGGHAITVNDSEWIDFPTINTTADTTSLLACHADGDGNMRAVVLLNAAPSSGNFASLALDNLVTPVLNTSINFDSNAPTNFSGYTSQVIGNTLVNDGTGTAWTLPTGDLYSWTINGVTIASMSSVGLGMSGTAGAGNITLGENSMTLSDIAVPANPGVGERRLFVDTATGETSVRTSGGVTVSLEAAGSVPDKIVEGDSSVEVVDAGTGSVAFVVDTVAQGTITDGVGWSIDNNVSINSTNTLTVGGVATFNGNTVIGSAATDTVAITADVSTNIIPSADGTLTIGDGSNHWDDVFTESLSFRGLGGTTTSTIPYITADGSNMIFNVPSTDGYVWKDNGITNFQFTEDGAAAGYLIRAGAAKNLGFIVSSADVALGSSGTIVAPVTSNTTTTKATLDGIFGDEPGSMGYLDSGSGNITLWFRQADGNWAGATLTRDTGT